MTRAVLYLRQSTYREESISLELQEAAGREHCRRHGYDVVGVESDPGISGRTWKRPAVQRVMEMVEQREADVVVLWRWSRLSRSRRDWALAADRADLAGGRIESATEPNDATAAGRFTRGVMTELAAFESERIGEQWKETHEHRVARGLPATGGNRFGYTHLHDPERYEQNDDAPLLRRAYLTLIDGESFVLAAEILSQSPTRTRHGLAWTPAAAARMLDTGFGAGLISRRRNRTGPPDPTGYVDGAHEAVITPAEWRSYLSHRRDAAPARLPRRRRVLSGLVRCAYCDGRMHIHHVAKTGRRRTETYRCFWPNAATPCEANRMQIQSPNLERAVVAWALSFDVADIVRAHVRAAEAARTTRTPSARSQLDRVRARIARLTTKWLDDELPESAYRATLATLTPEESRLAQLVADEESGPTETPIVPAAVLDMRTAWADLSDARRNVALAQLIDRVTVSRPIAPGSKRWRERITVVTTWGDHVRL